VNDDDKLTKAKPSSLLRLVGTSVGRRRPYLSFAFAATGQHDLAGAADLSRTSVRSTLRRIAVRGLIEPGYRAIVVRVPTALRDFVDDEG
jgi:hypothetical protein